MKTKTEKGTTETEVKNFYGGVYFDRCRMTDVKLQTLVQGDMRMEAAPDTGTDAVRPGSDRRVEEALAALKEATDADGGRIFTQKAHWYAVYRVLSELEGYPKQMKEFCKLMEALGMDRSHPALSYEMMKKVILPPVLKTARVSLWPGFLNKAEESVRRQIVVAAKLMDLLEKS